MRSLFVILLIAVGLLLSIPASVASWQERVIFNEDRFVSTVDESLEQPEVQEAIALRLTDTLMTELEIRNRIDTTLTRLEEEGPSGIPEGIALLGGPLTRVSQDAIYRATLRTIQEQPLANVRDTLLRAVHRLVIAVIEDDKDVLTEVNDQVVIDMKPILESAVLEIGGERGESLLENADLPEDAGIIVLADADDVTGYRLFFWWMNEAMPVLPIVAALLLLMAVVISRDRSRTVMIVGGLLVAVMALTILAVSVAGNFAADLIAQTPEGKEALKSIYDVIVRSFKEQQLFLIGAGVLLAIGGWLFGDSRAAESIRGRFRREQAAESAEGGGFAGWAREHAIALRGAGLVGGALLLVVWPEVDTRFVATVFALVAVYLLGLALITSDAGWAVTARARLDELSDRHLAATTGVKGGGFAGWVATHASSLRIAIVVLAIAFLVFWPTVKLSTVVVIVALGLLLLAGIDTLVNRQKEDGAATPPPSEPAG
jgi:hypothetical protein